MAATIYLHWTATGYDWIRPGRYHRIIGGDGRHCRMPSRRICPPTPGGATATASPSPAPAWAVSPTLDPTAHNASAPQPLPGGGGHCPQLGLDADDITIQSVMTHAEPASNREGRWMHDNYGPVIWGGTGERWDRCSWADGPSDGGEQLRQRIAALLSAERRSLRMTAGSVASPASRSAVRPCRCRSMPMAAPGR